MSSCPSLLLIVLCVLRGLCFQTSSILLFAMFIHGFGNALSTVGRSAVAAEQEELRHRKSQQGKNDVTQEGRGFLKH